ncbi:MAG: DUF2935 domain-containing protein [Ignavibacteriales bacterium]
MKFWLRILRDHTVFIFDNLGPAEQAAICQARALQAAFERLLAQAPVNPAEAATATVSLIEFKRSLLQRLLNCQITIHLQASDLNHMINEAQEFLRVLGCIAPIQGPVPVHVLHLLRLWIPDAGGHSSMLYHVLDSNESRLVRELRRFEKEFSMLYLKVIGKTEMFDRLRACFPSICHTAEEGAGLVRSHIDFLEQLGGLIGGCRVETTGSAAMVDHMIAEETHFLAHLVAYMGAMQ